MGKKGREVLNKGRSYHERNVARQSLTPKLSQLSDLPKNCRIKQENFSTLIPRGIRHRDPLMPQTCCRTRAGAALTENLKMFHASRWGK